MGTRFIYAALYISDGRRQIYYVRGGGHAVFCGVVYREKQ